MDQIKYFIKSIFFCFESYSWIKIRQTLFPMRSSMSSHKINNINGTLCLWQTDVDRLCDEVIIFGNAKTMYMFFSLKSKRVRLIVWKKWIGRRTFKFRRRKKNIIEKIISSRSTNARECIFFLLVWSYNLNDRNKATTMSWRLKIRIKISL